jgi:hypothetical protein
MYLGLASAAALESVIKLPLVPRANRLVFSRHPARNRN